MTKNVLHTPDGVRDIYGRECSDRILITEKIHSKMKSYGFEDINTPTFEFFDVYAEEINTSDTRELYKFFDKDGNTLVLRPDFTPSIARCASKVMLENGDPVRVCYEGNTFLNTSSLQGKLKENKNIGVELMNDSSVFADAEMIALLIESLKCTGLNDFQISIGDADYYKGICEEAGIDDETEEAVREQITGKNYFAAESIMVERKIPRQYIDLITKVSEFIGSDEALDSAEKSVSNERSLKAIARLKELYKVLTYYGVEKYVSFDLGILSKFNYYTGVIFSAYTYGVGDAIAKGGRYDNLLGKYGKDAPAIGFAIIVDDLMAALKRQNIDIEHEEKSEVITYTEDTFKEALIKAKELRSQGKKVVLKSE
jgi:ATP phosphoribosyltransferase regulatory subunit